MSTSLTTLERRAVEAVDITRLVDATVDLVRIPSFGGNESDAQLASAAFMREAGLDVDEWSIDLPALTSHPAASWELERTEARGVAGRLEGSGSGPTLVLNGHVDVVPPGDATLWSSPPFEATIRDGLLYGRGALDMKGPLMAGLEALRAVQASGARLSGSVLLHSVIGEEDGGLGTLATILRGHVGDAAIVMEPTNLALAPAQAGCLNFRVHVPGRGSHGAVRNEGVSALETMIHVHGALIDLEARRNAVDAGPLFADWPLPFPLSVGVFSGGGWPSSVPESACMEGRLGIRPTERPEDAKAEFERAVHDAADAHDFLRQHPPMVEWWGGRYLPAETSSDESLVGALDATMHDFMDEVPRRHGVPFGADAGLFHHVAKTPVVLFGAGDIRRAHGPDECVPVEALLHMSQILAVTILRYCGVENE